MPWLLQFTGFIQNIRRPRSVKQRYSQANGFGAIVYRSLQYGAANWAQATPVNKTVSVVKGTQYITFNPIVISFSILLYQHLH